MTIGRVEFMHGVQHMGAEMLDPAERDFAALLDSGKPEPAFQAFLESHPEFLVLPHLLHHGLLEDVLISQFPLDTSLTTDFVYLTKSSVEWRVVLVEIERPDKALFKESAPYATEHHELTAALAQVRTWAEFVERNREEILRRLRPWMRPLERNPVEFRYLLVIGRDRQLMLHQAMRDRWAALGGEGMLLATWDTLQRHYRRQRDRDGYWRAKLDKLLVGPGDSPESLRADADRGEPPLEWLPQHRPNIVSLARDKYTFKYLHREPESLFAWVGPDEFTLSTEHRERLLAWGYDILAWERGEMLRGGKPSKPAFGH
jgi:hypothetical protein